MNTLEFLQRAFGEIIIPISKNKTASEIEKRVIKELLNKIGDVQIRIYDPISCQLQDFDIQIEDDKNITLMIRRD